MLIELCGKRNCILDDDIIIKMKRVIICISNICGEETIKICNKRFVELVDAFKNVATNEQHKSLRGRKHIGSGKTKP